jgi:putative addiction module killer protein
VEATPYEILLCRDKRGREPFTRWLSALKDAKSEAIVLKRIDRLAGGNFGDVKPLGEGLAELKIDYGPGYRVYFGQTEKQIFIISGGSKRTQQRDIQAAKQFWSEYAQEK